MKKTKIAVVACAAIMSMSSMSLTTEALGNQTLTSAASTAITSVVELTSSFTSKTASFKSDYTSTTNAIRLNWNKVSGASGYRIYKYDSSAKKWVKVKTVKSGSTTTARITGLSAGSKYRFKVKAYKHYNGKTYWSKASSAKYAATKPKQVTMKASTATCNAIRLNWKKVKCDGYKIYQKVNGKYKLIATVRNSDTTTYRVTGLSGSTKYSFKIKAYRKDTAGKVVYGKGTIKKKTTKKATAPNSTKISSIKAYVPDSFVYDSTTYKPYAKIKLSWKKVDCDGYEIQIRDFAGKYHNRYVEDGNVTSATISSILVDSEIDYIVSVVPYNNDSSSVDDGRIFAEAEDTKTVSTYHIYDVDQHIENQEDPDGRYSKVTFKNLHFTSDKVKVTVDYEASYDLLRRTNELRSSLGLSKLVMDKDLLDLAVTRAAECTYTFNSTHYRPNGTVLGAENIGSASSVEEVFLALSTSSGHRANMIATYWKSCGMAVIDVEEISYNKLPFSASKSSKFMVQLFSQSSASKVSQPSNTVKTFTIKAITPTISY
ncbi:MAG: fibronectin type III domain-containing protein [Ruminococcus sp.]|nr:fibronectin type III domain-containing protein [Ruminococcus sp.]